MGLLCKQEAKAHAGSNPVPGFRKGFEMKITRELFSWWFGNFRLPFTRQLVGFGLGRGEIGGTIHPTVFGGFKMKGGFNLSITVARFFFQVIWIKESSLMRTWEDWFKVV